MLKPPPPTVPDLLKSSKELADQMETTDPKSPGYALMKKELRRLVRKARKMDPSCLCWPFHHVVLKHRG